MGEKAKGGEEVNPDDIQWEDNSRQRKQQCKCPNVECDWNIQELILWNSEKIVRGTKGLYNHSKDFLFKE